MQVWTNAASQAAFLEFALTAPPDVFSFEGAAQRLDPLEGLAAGRSSTGTANQGWLCLDLLRLLPLLEVCPLVLAMLQCNNSSKQHRQA